MIFLQKHFSDIIHHHNSETEGGAGTIFHISSDNEMATLISGVHLETVPIASIFCAAGLKMCVKHPCFQIFCISHI